MKFLTQLNSGCVDICKNMLSSAEKVGISVDDFIIACRDENAYDQMKNYSGAFLYDVQEYTDYQDWSFDETSKFRTIVKSKWKLISEIYRNNKPLCWIDTDIVFKSNPIHFFNINKNFILFQSDSPGSLICSGLMVFNHTPQCQQLIDECAQDTDEDDQILINKIALTNYKNSIALLPHDFFPNGHVYYTLGNKEKAIMVHNNHMVGIETKINKFKDEGLWHL